MENVDNKKRYLFLDILKFISLILMACIHVYNVIYSYELFGPSFNLDSISIQMSFIYLITPTIFMFCMGCGIRISRNSDSKSLFKRGIKLLQIGFILNLLRASIYPLKALVLNDISYLYEFWYWLWGSDILYFAGIYFMLFSLFRKLKLTDRTILLISILMIVLSNFIPEINISNYTLVEILGNFFYIDETSYFNILSWAIYPTLGYIFMGYYVNSKDKKVVINRYGLGALLIFVISIAVLFLTNKFDISLFLWGETDFKMNYSNTLLTLCIAIMWVCIVERFANYIKVETKFVRFISYSSRNLNKIYLIHWVLLMYISFLWPFLVKLRVNSIWTVYPLGIMLFLMSLLICYRYNNIKEKRNINSK